MLSMTGYGRAAGKEDGREIIVEAKSVNHRFLDISLKMPRSLLFAEDSVKSYIASRLARGHVELTVSYRNMREDAYEIVPDEVLAGKYISAIREIGTKYGIAGEPDAAYISSLPDVLKVNAAEEDREAVEKLLLKCCEEALDELIDMRVKEGGNLEKDILLHLELLSGIRDEIEKIAPEVPALYRERLLSRIRELGVEADPQRIAQETALMSDKCAVDEELSRLSSHIGQMRGVLENAGETGKKLDFLTQELNRECNTIGSKANDARITNLVVSAKNEVEKIREQVQNAE